MIRTFHVSAAFLLAAGLTAPGAALAQTQPDTATASPPSASAPPAASPTQSTSMWVPKTPDFKAWEPNAGQPTYSVTPPQGSSGVYLPAAVLGYAKSVAGCVVIGCEDGPQVGAAAAGSASSESALPPPDNQGLLDRR